MVDKANPEIWHQRPSILIDGEYISELFPTAKWSRNRNMNAIARLCILIISTILLIYSENRGNVIKVLSIILLLIIILVLFDMKKLGKENKEGFSNKDHYAKKEKRKEYYSDLDGYEIHYNTPKYNLRESRFRSIDDIRRDYRPDNESRRNLNVYPDREGGFKGEGSIGRNSHERCRGKGRFNSFQTNYYNDPQVHWSGTMEPYPFDNRTYRELGNKGGRGMHTCDYEERDAFKSPSSIMDIFENVTGNKKRVATRSLNQTIDFNSNQQLFHDRENAYFRDNYTRNRLRVAIGESNRTIDGHLYGAPQETRARKNIPRMTYLDKMGIYE